MERPFLNDWKTGEKKVLPHHTEEEKQDTKVVALFPSFAALKLTW